MLYEHQRKALDKLKTGSILCGGVGTGKSRTALAYYHVKVCHGTMPKKSTRYFSRGDRIPLYIITTARKRDSHEWEAECSPFLISKEADDLVIDSWNNIKKYIDVEGAFFIFDEQRLVGEGAWSKAFLKIAKQNDWILLTATPGDTWMDYATVFIANGYYKNYRDFKNKHVVYNRFVKFPKIEKYVWTNRLERIRDELVISMEYTKEAIQHHEWVKVAYDSTVYDVALKNRWNIYNNEPVENISELCYLLRKIANSDSHRLTALDHILKNHPKAIVFYNFDYELENLRSYCEKVGYVYSEWNGHKHEELPTGDRWVYLVQYMAGGEGWNCIKTDTTIFYSQNYSYRMMIQASGRIDRLNTPFHDLYYYHIFCDAPIDRAIKQCLAKKKDFNERTFSASNGIFFEK